MFATVLEKGSGKVFSYEYLRDKRIKRAEEGAAKEVKAKARRGRKFKNTTQENATQEVVRSLRVLR